MTLLADSRSRVFVAVLLWKLLLLVFVWLPVPTNDSFFYDGGVVNLLLHGQYFNPSLTINYPISGRELFSAYPPLSQGILLAWMTVFGTSEFAAIALHFVLFAVYALLVLATLIRLNLPGWTIHLAGLFLLGITFHDRPDSVAHVCGMFAVYAWVRAGFAAPSGATDSQSSRWHWVMATAIVLCLAASLQIGATYGFLVWCGLFLARFATGQRIPVLPLGAMVIAPALVIGGFTLFWPRFCQGFVESASTASFFTGLHTPGLMEVLKIVRSAPGVLAAAGLVFLTPLPGLVLGGRFLPQDPAGIFGLTVLLAAIPVTLASLFAVSANTIAIAAYLQPVAAGATAAWICSRLPDLRWRRVAGSLFLAGSALCSVRAIGLSTWGVACALDQSPREALDRAEAQITNTPAGGTVVLSGAFLYRAARHENIRWIHSDHPGQFTTDAYPALAPLLSLQPDSLVLTQFDYYRRYESSVQELMRHPEWANIRVTQKARVPAPDSIPSLRRVLQHVSWAPVIVEFDWKEPAGLRDH